MPPHSQKREFAFILNDVARLLRTYANYHAAQFALPVRSGPYWYGWSVAEGLNQTELADILDLQPITLTGSSISSATAA